MAKPPVTIGPDALAHVPAWKCGAYGGTATAASQFIGNGAGGLNETLGLFFKPEIWAGMYNLTYFIVALAITAFCGGVISHFLQSWTRNRWILFLAGVSATSILSSAAPGVLKILHLSEFSPVSVAYAQQQPVEQVCTSPSFSLGEGLKQFFRISEPTGYRVVVGSFKNRSDAAALANKISLTDPTLHPSIADKYPGNDFYAVIVGPSSTTFDDARRIQKKVMTLDYVPGAFISRWGC